MNKGWTILISSSDGLGNSSVPAVENCLPSGNGTDGVVDLTGRLIAPAGRPHLVKFYFSTGRPERRVYILLGDFKQAKMCTQH